VDHHDQDRASLAPLVPVAPVTGVEAILETDVPGSKTKKSPYGSYCASLAFGEGSVWATASEHYS
jgi:hypothetical protein